MKPRADRAVLLARRRRGPRPAGPRQAALVAPETTGHPGLHRALIARPEAELRLHAAREGARPAAVRDVAVGVALPRRGRTAADPPDRDRRHARRPGYRYVATDAGLAIVNPETRRVVRLIEAP
jgi:hypothetical protein